MKKANVLRVLGLLTAASIGASAFATEYTGSGDRFDLPRGANAFVHSIAPTTLKVHRPAEGRFQMEAAVEGGKNGPQVYVLDLIAQDGRGDVYAIQMKPADYLRVMSPLQPASILERIQGPLAAKESLVLGTATGSHDGLLLKINTVTPIESILSGDDLALVRKESPRLEIQIIISKTVRRVVLIKNKFKGDTLVGSSTHVLDEVRDPK